MLEHTVKVHFQYSKIQIKELNVVSVKELKQDSLHGKKSYSWAISSYTN